MSIKPKLRKIQKVRGELEMRENLYRGKHKDDGKWIEGYFYKIWDRTFILWGMTNDSPNMEEVIPETVGQYTGLKDKNGKKIFEGDICRVVYLDSWYDSNNKRHEVENALIEEVVFEKGAFCFKVTIEDIPFYRPIGFDLYEKLKIKYFEVIGNIHDNPELLEVGV